MKPALQVRTGTRSEKILRTLQQAGSVSVEELGSLLDVSIATVRRDLQDLEDHGLLRRTHGGATTVEPLLYEPFRHDSSFRDQTEKHAEEKRRIAIAAADLIEDGDTISLTAGTTTTEVVRGMRHRSGITVSLRWPSATFLSGPTGRCSWSAGMKCQ